jgi:hypothetical protein
MVGKFSICYSNHMYDEIFAHVAVTILAALAVFQLVLAAGAPLGKYAWGGQHKVLPMKLRVASVYSVLLYGVFGFFILSQAGAVNLIPNKDFVQGVMYAFTGYFILGILLNAISRSRSERAVMTPIAVILALLFLAVSL